MHQQSTQKVEASRVPEYIKKAAKKAAEFNSNLNRERMEERRAYFDLQTHVRLLWFISPEPPFLLVCVECTVPPLLLLLFVPAICSFFPRSYNTVFNGVPDNTQFTCVHVREKCLLLCG